MSDPITTSVASVKPRPTLAGGIYPGMEADLNSLKIDGKPLTPAEKNVARKALAAMIAATRVVPGKDIDPKGKAVITEAFTNNTLTAQSAQKLWGALFPKFYRDIEKKLMLHACRTKGPRPTLAGGIYPGMEADLNSLKIDGKPLTPAEKNVARKALAAMIAATRVVPGKDIDPKGKAVITEAFTNNTLTAQSAQKLWGALFPKFYRDIEKKLMADACPAPTPPTDTLGLLRDVWGVYFEGSRDITGQNGAGMLGGSGLTTDSHYSPALQSIFPAFGVVAGFNPSLAGPKTIFDKANYNMKNPYFQWNMNAGITARRLITSGNDTHSFSVKTGTEAKLLQWAPGWTYLQPSVSTEYEYGSQQQGNPNLFYADGTHHQLGVKGGLFSDSKYLAARAYYAYQFKWFDHSFNNVMGVYEMDGNEELHAGGLEALVRINQRSKWAPDVKVGAEVGRVKLHVPVALEVDYRPVVKSKDVVAQTVFSGSLSLLWKRLSVIGGVIGRDIAGGWSHEHRGWFGGGYEWDSGWHLRGTLNFYELDPANPVSGVFANILFTPGGPKWLRPFTIQAMFGNHGGGASLGFDFYKALKYIFAK